MGGYEDKVIMAAGTFTEGSTIELSCDGPIREPFIAYMQGGLTYDYGKYGILNAIEEILLDKSSLRRMDYKDLISLHQAILKKKQLSVNMVRTFVDDTIKNSLICI